jgi:hypothetical protein
MVWNNQQCPIGSAPLPEYMPTIRINPNLMVDLLRPIIREIPRRVKTNVDVTRNSKIVFPTVLRTFSNTGMTNLCVKSVVVIAMLQRNVIPQVILLIST